MTDLHKLLDALRVQPLGDDRFVAPPMPGASGVTYGGLVVGQLIMSASSHPIAEGKEVKTIHTVFSRPARADEEIVVALAPTQSGRTFGSAVITASQGGTTVSQALVLLSAPEPDSFRHEDRMPAVARPSSDPPRGAHGLDAWKLVMPDNTDLDDPTVGPPSVDVWSRFAGAPDDLRTGQALLAYATDAFLIGAALRPHEGVSQKDAHVGLTTGVVSHTVTFHEPARAGEWFLLSQRSTYAGRGRAYGRGDVFTASGPLLASFVQDAVIRRQA